MMMTYKHGMLTAALAVMVCLGCRRRESAAPERTAPAPLARVGDAVITEDDFHAEARRRRETGRPIGDPDTLLREMIEREAMLAKARASDLYHDPSVRRERENQLLARWLDASLQRELDRIVVTDEDLRRRYEADLDRFTTPPRVRLAMLFRRLDGNASAEEAAALREALASARAAYLADPEGVTQNGRIPGFGTVAADASEDTISRYRGGDLGWLDVTRGDYRWPRPIIEAGIGLERGQVSAVIAAGEGFYVVMKSDERPAETVPFDEAAARLRRHVIREKQEAVRQAFMQSLMEDVRADINPDKLAALALPPEDIPPPPPELRPVEDYLPDVR